MSRLASPGVVSKRAMEVAAALSRGLENKEIADELRISEATLKSHLKALSAKLGLHNRVQIAVWYVTKGVAGV